MGPRGGRSVFSVTPGASTRGFPFRTAGRQRWAVRGKPHCNSQQALGRPTLKGCGVAPPRLHGKCSPLPGRLPTAIGKGESGPRWRRGSRGGRCSSAKGHCQTPEGSRGKKSSPAGKAQKVQRRVVLGPEAQDFTEAPGKCSSRSSAMERGPELLGKALSAGMKWKHLRGLRRGDIPGPQWGLRSRGW